MSSAALVAAVNKAVPPAPATLAAAPAQNSTRTPQKILCLTYPDDPGSQSTLPEAHVVPRPPRASRKDRGRHAELYQDHACGPLHPTGHIVIHYKDYVVPLTTRPTIRPPRQIVAEGNLTSTVAPMKRTCSPGMGRMNLEAHTAHLYDVAGTLGHGKATEVKTVTTYSPGSGTSEQPKQVLHLTPAPLPSPAGDDSVRPERYRIIEGTMTSCRLPTPTGSLSRTISSSTTTKRWQKQLFELTACPSCTKCPSSTCHT